MSAAEAAPKDRPATTAAAKRLTANRTTDRRQKSAATHVIVPNAVWVVAASGNSRLLLPWRCLTCGATHLSQGRGDIPSTVNRRGPHGPIVLHIAAAEVAG